MAYCECPAEVSCYRIEKTPGELPATAPSCIGIAKTLILNKLVQLFQLSGAHACAKATIEILRNLVRYCLSCQLTFREEAVFF